MHKHDFFFYLFRTRRTLGFGRRNSRHFCPSARPPFVVLDLRSCGCSAHPARSKIKLKDLSARALPVSVARPKTLSLVGLDAKIPLAGFLELAWFAKGLGFFSCRLTTRKDSRICLDLCASGRSIPQIDHVRILRLRRTRNFRPVLARHTPIGVEGCRLPRFEFTGTRPPLGCGFSELDTGLALWTHDPANRTCAFIFRAQPTGCLALFVRPLGTL